MADAKKDAKSSKKRGKAGTFLFLIIIGLCTPFMLPSVILLIAGLVPTYVAFSTDSDPQKSGAVSVGAMNLAGILPFIIDLWSKGQTMENALQILATANTWLVILGVSAIGQLIVYAIPQAVATLTLVQVEMRLKTLNKNLESLKESWGPDVATAKPIDKIIPE